MPFNTTNMLMSLALLHNARVPQDKKLAASMGAALLPGMLGLALPLIVARNHATPDVPAGGAIRTAVPNLAGRSESEAIAMLERAKLAHQVTRAWYQPSDSGTAPPKGQVVTQQPKAGEYVDIGSTVRIEVSEGVKAGAGEAGQQDEHAHHTAFEQQINDRLEQLDDKVEMVLDNLSRPDGAVGAPH